VAGSCTCRADWACDLCCDVAARVAPSHWRSLVLTKEHQSKFGRLVCWWLSVCLPATQCSGSCAVASVLLCQGILSIHTPFYTGCTRLVLLQPHAVGYLFVLVLMLAFRFVVLLCHGSSGHRGHVACMLVWELGSSTVRGLPQRAGAEIHRWWRGSRATAAAGQVAECRPSGDCCQ
jgi:hypothetical protein